MSKQKRSDCSSNNSSSSSNSSYIENTCNSQANSYVILSAIFTAIISEEIQNDDDLGMLGTFLQTLGQDISLVSQSRIICKQRIKNGNPPPDITPVFDRHSNTPNIKKYKKIKKRYKKTKKTK
ncbi:MAG: hypothetical protein RRZ84_02645 [Romboutsia sp.]